MKAKWGVKTRFIHQMAGGHRIRSSRGVELVRLLFAPAERVPTEAHHARQHWPHDTQTEYCAWSQSITHSEAIAAH